MMDLKYLARELNELGIMNKAFIDMNEEEINSLCLAVIDAAGSYQPPYLLPEVNGNETLVVPFSSPPEYRYWTIQDHEARRRALISILRMLNAKTETFAAYGLMDEVPF